MDKPPPTPKRAMSVSELYARIDQRIDERMKACRDREVAHLDKRFLEIKDLLTSAFPGGDPDEHRRYHAEVMEFIAERKALWRSIREKTLTALVWSGLVFVGVAIWFEVKRRLGM